MQNEAVCVTSQGINLIHNDDVEYNTIKIEAPLHSLLLWRLNTRGFYSVLLGIVLGPAAGLNKKSGTDTLISCKLVPLVVRLDANIEHQSHIWWTFFESKSFLIDLEEQARQNIFKHILQECFRFIRENWTLHLWQWVTSFLETFTKLEFNEEGMRSCI